MRPKKIIRKFNSKWTYLWKKSGRKFQSIKVAPINQSDLDGIDNDDDEELDHIADIPIIESKKEGYSVVVARTKEIEKIINEMITYNILSLSEVKTPYNFELLE